MRLKSEVYYQSLYDIPGLARSSFYSGLNEGADFGAPGIDSLVNNGTGRNYGVELTLEKFYSKGYYFYSPPHFINLISLQVITLNDKRLFPAIT